MTREIKPLIKFEQLEPRILLSGDSLHNIAPNPQQDTIFENTSVAYQFVELLYANGQFEDQISLELTQPDTTNTDVCQPVITLPVEDENIKDESSVADLSVDNIEPHQVNIKITILSNVSDGEIESKIGITEDGIMPTPSEKFPFFL